MSNPTRRTSRTPDGPPPPVVQRLRLRYARRGRLRFSSHRDFQRALERALRRIGAPMAYSAGFTPHPKVSYAGAAPTGAASEAEYLELGLAAVVVPDDFARELDAALPDGLDVVEAVEVRTAGLADRLEASLWRIELPGAAPEAVRSAMAALLALDHFEVVRRTKAGHRTLDVRAAMVSLDLDPGIGHGADQGTDPTSTGQDERRAAAGQEGCPEDAPGLGGAARRAQGDPVDCAILRLVVRHTTPAVRPDDVLAALIAQGPLAPPSVVRTTRLAQGPLDQHGGTVTDPLVADRDAVGA